MKKGKILKRIVLFCFLLTCLSWFSSNIIFAADLFNASGKISSIRVHALKSGYGPPQDFIDVEVVIKLDSKPEESIGFQLRDNNDDTEVRRAMLDLLKDAFKNNWNVSITYWMEPGKKNGILHRVTVVK
mgnify:CR=1 FL=1